MPSRALPFALPPCPCSALPSALLLSASVPYAPRALDPAPALVPCALGLTLPCHAAYKEKPLANPKA